MHHTVRTNTRADISPIDMRVAGFEMIKEESNSAIKKVTIDHMSNAQGRLETMAIGSRPMIV